VQSIDFMKLISTCTRNIPAKLEFGSLEFTEPLVKGLNVKAYITGKKFVFNR
jgi:hypothetical protein